MCSPFDRHIWSKRPFFGGTAASCWCKRTALRNALIFFSDVYSSILLLSEVPPQFIFKLSPHIDGTPRQMLCKFEGDLTFHLERTTPALVGQRRNKARHHSPQSLRPLALSWGGGTVVRRW